MRIRSWLKVPAAAALCTALGVASCGGSENSGTGDSVGGASGNAGKGASSGTGGSANASTGGSSTGEGGTAAGGTSSGGTSGAATGGDGGVSAGSGTAGTSGSGAAAGCLNGTTQCTNCVDDDGDGFVDALDPECSGPLDSNEATFATGIPGDNIDFCQDCFFDGDSGQGNDGCAYHTDCLYGGNPGGAADCMNCEVSARCVDYCTDFTPNGCDCFGCCAIQDSAGATHNVLLSTTCTINDLADETKCEPCVQSTTCGNDCGHCELCIGKDVLPPDCNPGTGGAGGTGGAAGAPGSGGSGGTGQVCSGGQAVCNATTPCATGYYCLTGCCIPVIE